MNRTTKIVLGIVGGILLLCCIVGGVILLLLPRFAENVADEILIEDSGEAAEIGQTIAEYELPTGFVEEGAMSLFGINMVFAAANSGEGGAIMMMSFPEELAGNEAEMQRQMEDSFRDQSGRQNVQLIFKESQEITINGEAATLSIYEGTDENGVSIRQASAVFQTKEDGPGMLMIFAPLSSWEDGRFDGFFGSIE